jgi:hypothetical protein
MTDSLQFTSGIADAGHPESAPVPAALTAAIAGTSRRLVKCPDCVAGVILGVDCASCDGIGVTTVPETPRTFEQHRARVVGLIGDADLAMARAVVIGYLRGTLANRPPEEHAVATRAALAALDAITGPRLAVLL